MIEAINSGLSGLLSASKRTDQAAANIANISTPGIKDEINLSEEAVNLILAEAEFKANAATITTASELSDELLSLLDDE